MSKQRTFDIFVALQTIPMIVIAPLSLFIVYITVFMPIVIWQTLMLMLGWVFYTVLIALVIAVIPIRSVNWPRLVAIGYIVLSLCVGVIALVIVLIEQMTLEDAILIGVFMIPTMIAVLLLKLVGKGIESLLSRWR